MLLLAAVLRSDCSSNALLYSSLLSTSSADAASAPLPGVLRATSAPCRSAAAGRAAARLRSPSGCCFCPVLAATCKARHQLQQMLACDGAEETAVLWKMAPQEKLLHDRW